MIRFGAMDHFLDGPHGPLRVRVYSPDAGGRGIGLVWVHGGGFKNGDLDMPESDAVARALARAGVWVASVEYRRAPLPESEASPQNPARPGWHYPVAAEEVAAAYLWSVERLGSRTRVLLGGASAGANIAAGVVLRLQRAGSPLPAGVLLAYPTLHYDLPERNEEILDRLRERPDDRFEPHLVRAMNDNYLGTARPVPDEFAFPGDQTITEFPATLILNSEADSLRASGQAFGARLASAGVDLVMYREAGSWHGHLNRPGEQTFSRSIARILWWMDGLDSCVVDA